VATVCIRPIAVIRQWSMLLRPQNSAMSAIAKIRSLATRRKRLDHKPQADNVEIGDSVFAVSIYACTYICFSIYTRRHESRITVQHSF
jgi:hypothetical protein